jgi:hypothetical protein
VVEVEGEDFGLDSIAVVDDDLAGHFGAVDGLFCGIRIRIN